MNNPVFTVIKKVSNSTSARGWVRVCRDGGELLAVEYCCHTLNENIRHFDRCVISEHTTRMLSGWLAETGHSPSNLAHALPSHFYQGQSPGLWTI
jgi:hypothetical protein